MCEPARRPEGALPVHDCNHILRRLANSFAETLWPTRCVGCDDPGTLLCAACDAGLDRIDQRIACPRCGAPWGRVICTQCPAPGATDRDERPLPAPFPFAAARAAASFSGAARELVLAYKDGGERRLDEILAREICRAVRGSWRIRLPDDVEAHLDPAPDWTSGLDAVVGVPATPEALRRRGFDHVGCIVGLVAADLDLPDVAALSSGKSADQRVLSAEARRENRAGVFTLREDVAGARVLLLDDVMTTGATASAASELLLDGGAESVHVAVFARVW